MWFSGPRGRAVIASFDVDTTRTGADAVVRVIGELDVASAPRLRDELVDLVQHGVRAVTVDLAQLDFIDSTGLTVLAGGLKRLREQGGDLILRSLNPNAMKVFEITGLTKVFTIT